MAEDFHAAVTTAVAGRIAPEYVAARVAHAGLTTDGSRTSFDDDRGNTVVVPNELAAAMLADTIVRTAPDTARLSESPVPVYDPVAAGRAAAAETKRKNAIGELAFR